MNRWSLPPEWYKQSGVQLTWPHKDTDWEYMLNEVEECYIRVAEEISKREKLIIATPTPQVVKELLKSVTNIDNITIHTCNSNDTWARDHAGVSVIDTQTGKVTMLDFGFNGWGNKFEAALDNKITATLHKNGVFNCNYTDKNSFILEGGSIEVDGAGSLMTTTRCLLSKERNPQLLKSEVEAELKASFGIDNIIWIENGYLAGDDTDSHIDTLARFCPNNTIAYVKCDDINDEHYAELKAMEDELKLAKNSTGEPYRVVPLPMADAVVVDGERIPATYANFLIVNGAVLYPTYNQPQNDKLAAAALQECFPDYEIVGIDCSALIKQHGSLHCITMQYPTGVV